MKLNPSKCTFEVLAEKFHRFMVSQWGIEANPKKVKAILDMQTPRSTKEVQRLVERVTTLSKFISRATNKCYPFFRLVKKALCLDEECDKAFEELKDNLGHLPLNN